ncbi:MAG: SLC13 family permease [Muribaculaceae bacterium]|nr:SLC13 family permease [uncultured Oscillibacter sp.]
MIATLIILALSAALFVSGRVRSDLVAVCSALALVLCGVLTPEEALSGFSNPVVAMMAGLFIVGGGIFSTGLAKMAGSRILGLAGTSETRLFVLVMAATAAVGAFVSNTGTVALMLPIVVSMARGAGLSPSRFLMPLAFAGSMGGMLTLIGTPPNLIVRDALVDAGYEPLSFFSFTPVGILCIVTGTAALLPLSRWFLRGKSALAAVRGGKSLEQLAEEYRLTESLMRLRVSAGAKVTGRTVKELDVYGRYGVTVIEVRRTTSGNNRLLRRVTQFSVADVKLAEGDVLYLTGPAEGTRLMAAENRLEVLSGKERRKRLSFYDVGMAEVLLLPTSKFTGRTVAETDLRKRLGLNVLGVRRHSTYLLTDIKNIRLHASDVMLVQGPWSNISRLTETDDEWVVLGSPLKEAARVTLDYKAPVAALIMLLMVAAMAFDFIPVAPVTAVMLAAVAMIVSGCLRGVEAAYKTINWESIILFGAMLPMSVALEKTGASTLISGTLVDTFGGGGPYLLLAAVYLTTSVLTFFISNTVTAVLMAPIALSAASESGVNAVPMLMAVTVAASMCFASPFSTPPNALVMSAGSYTPLDYVKVGLPLQLLMAVVMIVALPLIFPF